MFQTYACAFPTNSKRSPPAPAWCLLESSPRFWFGSGKDFFAVIISALTLSTSARETKPNYQTRQTPAISRACSPAALHAVPNPSIHPAGCWQEATAGAPSSNQTQIRPTLSVYLFSSLPSHSFRPASSILPQPLA